MKTTESHAMRCAQELLTFSFTKQQAERVVVSSYRPPVRVDIHCTDGAVIPVTGHDLWEMLRAIKRDMDEAARTVAEIEALKRMEDLA